MRVIKQFKSEREFTIACQQYELGMVSAFKHMKMLSGLCEKAHKQILKDVKITVKMNSHLIKP